MKPTSTQRMGAEVEEVDRVMSKTANLAFNTKCRKLKLVRLVLKV